MTKSPHFRQVIRKTDDGVPMIDGKEVKFADPMRKLAEAVEETVEDVEYVLLVMHEKYSIRRRTEHACT